MTVKLYLVLQLAFLLTAHVFSQVKTDLLVPVNSSEASKYKLNRSLRGTGNHESLIKIPATISVVSNQDIISQNSFKNVSGYSKLEIFQDPSTLTKNEYGKRTTQDEDLISEKYMRNFRLDEESNPIGAFTTNAVLTSEQFSNHEASKHGKLNIFLTKASNSTENVSFKIRKNYYCD